MSWYDGSREEMDRFRLRLLADEKWRDGAATVQQRFSTVEHQVIVNDNGGQSLGK